MWTILAKGIVGRRPIRKENRSGLTVAMTRKKGVSREQQKPPPRVTSLGNLSAWSTQESFRDLGLSAWEASRFAGRGYALG